MKRISLLLTVIAFALSVNAQLLWKVTGNGLDKPSYLFGTHHIAPVSILDSITGFKDALASVDRVYGEIDMSKMTDGAVQMKMMQMVMAPADSTLSKVIPADVLKNVDKLLTEFNVPANTAQLEPLKPASVATTVSVLLAKKAFPDFDPAKQLDQTIQAMARERNVPVEGLESIDHQLNVLFGTPISEQAQSLIKTLSDTQQAIETTQLMADAYITGNLSRLNDLMHDPKTGMDDEEAKKLITDRNNAWLEILLGMIPTASVMVVVGAGHLPGDTGLISQLRKAGYKVEPAK